MKVINYKLEEYGSNFKVRRMNSDKIIVNYSNGNGIINNYFSGVECICEN